MALVKVEKLVAGAVLTEAVQDFNARLLLPKGQVLEKKHLRILKMWGIGEVEIEGPDPDAPTGAAPVDSAVMASVSDAIRELFGAVDITHPAVKEVVRLSIACRLERPLTPRQSVRPLKPSAQTVSSREMLAKIDRQDIALPEVPTMVYQLNEIIADPMSSAGDIAGVVNKSPSLTATLLKVVNSAFYGLRSKIDNISRAVMMIGARELSSLAMAVTIMETFKNIPREAIDVASFLEHSLACGVVARILAGYGGMANTEQLFVSGMLHDIGRLVMCKYFPQNIKVALSTAAEAGEPDGP